MCLKDFRSTTAIVSVFSSEMYSFSCVGVGTADGVCAINDMAAKQVTRASVNRLRFIAFLLE